MRELVESSSTDKRRTSKYTTNDPAWCNTAYSTFLCSTIGCTIFSFITFTHFLVPTLVMKCDFYVQEYKYLVYSVLATGLVNNYNVLFQLGICATLVYNNKRSSNFRFIKYFGNKLNPKFQL